MMEEAYVIHVKRPDLRRFVYGRWTATATVGPAKFAGVWQARSYERLIRKATRGCRDHALSKGFRDPAIEVDTSQLELQP